MPPTTNTAPPCRTWCTRTVTMPVLRPSRTLRLPNSRSISRHGPRPGAGIPVKHVRHALGAVAKARVADGDSGHDVGDLPRLSTALDRTGIIVGHAWPQIDADIQGKGLARRFPGMTVSPMAVDALRQAGHIYVAEGEGEGGIEDAEADGKGIVGADGEGADARPQQLVADGAAHHYDRGNRRDPGDFRNALPHR